jgi:hypothetical protein
VQLIAGKTDHFIALHVVDLVFSNYGSIDAQLQIEFLTSKFPACGKRSPQTNEVIFL